MIKKFLGIIGCLIVLEFLLIVAIGFLSFSDAPLPQSDQRFVGFLEGTLKYILGFPMVLLNSDFPFFLDRDAPLPLIVMLVLVNNSIIAWLILFVVGKIKQRKSSKISN